MPQPNTRRDFLLLGGATAAGLTLTPAANAAPTGEFATYSRWKPSHGGPPESDHYLGKLLPGLRAAGLPPVPVTALDTPTLPFRMVNGVKEFELHCTPLKREFLPGYPMTV